MPPEIPPTRLPQPATARSEVPPEYAAVASFLGVDGVGAGLISTGFTRKEATETLIGIIRTAESDKDKIAALKQLDASTVKLLEVNGMLPTLKESHEDQDGRTTRSVTALSIDRLLTAPLTPLLDTGGVTIHSPVTRDEGSSDHPQSGAAELPPGVDRPPDVQLPTDGDANAGA